MAKDPRDYTKKELGRDFTMYGGSPIGGREAKKAVVKSLKKMGLTSAQIREAFETPVSGSKVIGRRNVLLSKGRKGKGSPGTDYTKGKQAPNFSATNVKKKALAKSKKARAKSLKEPVRRKGPGRPTMTSMVAKAPKPRNKNVTKRPKRPSKQGSFGR